VKKDLIRGAKKAKKGQHVSFSGQRSNKLGRGGAAMEIPSLPKYPEQGGVSVAAPQRRQAPEDRRRGPVALKGLAVAAFLISTLYLKWTVPLETATAAMEVIKGYCGRDLRNLEPDQIRDLLGHLSTLGLEYDPDLVARYGPWNVWDFGRKEEPPLYLLFEAGKKREFRSGNQVIRLHPHPSATRVYMTLLDGSGKVVSQTGLTTGWRCYLRDARLQPIGDGDYPLVVLETELGGGPGPDVGRQYYAWVGQQNFDLVRLEDTRGGATRNRHYIEHFRCGPEIAWQTVEEWEADVCSADRWRVLRALVWLGGFHWDLKPNGTDVRQYEDADQVHVLRKVRAREKVIARLRDLVESDDPWLREAARLAANPKDGHF
jgi:hypothetical protein